MTLKSHFKASGRSEGKIQYASEIWNATAEGKRFLKGERIKICGFRGLKLLVEK